jgi:Protein kinase domain
VRGDGGAQLSPTRLGRYHLLRKLAVGGMAEIYLARVSGAGGFEKNVVLKRILPQLAESDEFFAMFMDEARIAATLQHPNLVHIYDAGQAGTDYFIAMEHLDGADLHTVRRVLAERKENLPLQHAIFIVSAVAAGLHYAHEKLGLDGRPLHIVHRDVTPQNVFLTREGGVKLVDFGIAKATNRKSTTSYGTLKGKLAYMSPEQCRAEPVDRRSDVYALGILLYELTAGRRPHPGTSEYELLREIVEGEVPPPSQVKPDYPADLEPIAMRALARDRADRYPNALAMEQDLEKFARRHELVGSTLAMAEFLAPVLSRAQEQAEMRYRRRLSTAPPPADGVAGDWWAAGDGDQQITVAAILGRKDRPGTARPHDEPGGGARPPARIEATPLPERVPAAPAAAEDVFTDPQLDGMRLRSRRTFSIGLVVLVLLLAAGAAAAFYDHRVAGARGHQEATPETPAASPAKMPARSVPELGSLRVTSDPPGAAVWLSLGPTPALAGPIDPGRPHRIRVDHDGYRPRDLMIEPGMLRIAAGLEPATGAEPPLPEPTALPAGPADASPAAPHAEARRVHVSSRPPAARVWLLVGVTPTVIAPVSTAGQYEIRLARDGYLPSFVTVGPERFDDGGEARLEASLPASTKASDALDRR